MTSKKPRPLGKRLDWGPEKKEGKGVSRKPTDTSKKAKAGSSLKKPYTRRDAPARGIPSALFLSQLRLKGINLPLERGGKKLGDRGETSAPNVCQIA